MGRESSVEQGGIGWPGDVLGERYIAGRVVGTSFCCLNLLGISKFRAVAGASFAMISACFGWLGLFW